MLILYAALKHDYGRPGQGFSFEHYNFYESLVRMGHDVIYFDIGSLVTKYGKQTANERLTAIVKSERPHAMFTVMFRDELDERTMRNISEGTDTATIAWFSDDHWRFDTYTRFRAPWFNWSVTTSTDALTKYRALGYTNVVKSQWACNPFLYAPMEVRKQFPVSFVGLPHGTRRFTIEALEDAGIDVHTFGKGWENGRLTQEQMIRVFNESEINLNLANASSPRSPARRTLNLLSQSVGRLPLSRSARRVTFRLVSAVDHQLWRQRTDYPEQIKGRNFEVPGCGAFLLTGPADNLEDYYTPNEEVGYYDGSIADLVHQIRRFLSAPDLRAAIARAGRERTIREHTYPHRFDSIFRVASLQTLPVCEILAGRVSLGRTVEVD